MSNHYHLLLETPRANLSAGMGWFLLKDEYTASFSFSFPPENNGYHGAQLSDYRERKARALMGAGLKVYGLGREELRKQPKGEERKALLATMIQDETTMKLGWISEELNMGTRAGVCRNAKLAREKAKSDRRRCEGR